MARAGRMPHPLLIAAAICVGLGVASLAAPSGATYDPYSWLIWGRDLAHLDLVTRGTGTSWKPLPALIDAVLMPVGGGAPAGWLAVARAGALFSVFMAFRLAWRLTPRRGRVVAGLIAAVSVALTRGWLQQTGIAYAEGLMVAFGLLAVDRHLDGHRVQAFALIVAAGLIHVEAWPFVAVYGAWLWTTEQPWRVRLGVAVGWLLIPVLWFGGDWIGSGRLTTGADRALSRRIPGSPGASAHPVLAVAREAFTTLPLPAWIAIAAAIAIPHACRRVTVTLAGCAAAWTAVVAAMAQLRYGGLPRFLFMATGLEAVVAGIGAGCTAAAIARALGLHAERPGAQAAARGPQLRLPRIGWSGAAGAMVALGICAAFAVGSVPAIRTLAYGANGIDHVADLDARRARSVRGAGGAAAVLRCGHPETPWWTVTALAWDLDVAPTYLRRMPKREGRPAHKRSAGAGSGRPARSSRRQSHRRHSLLLRRSPSCGHRRV